MPHMRPGTKVKFWSPRFTNRPEVVAPGLLRLVGATSIFSVIGFLLFAVGQAFMYTSMGATGLEATYVTVLHFVLPLAAFYTIISNRPLSRMVIAVYVIAVCGATIAGKGFLGKLEFDPNVKTIAAIAIASAILGWLFGSPKMRYYYAAISDKPIPSDLADRVDELQPKNWLGHKQRAALAWFLDHMETVVLFGFIILAIYAFARTG